MLNSSKQVSGVSGSEAKEGSKSPKKFVLYKSKLYFFHKAKYVDFEGEEMNSKKIIRY